MSINPAPLAEIVVDAGVTSFEIEERSGQDTRLLGIAEALVTADTQDDRGRLAYDTISVSLVAHLLHMYERRCASDANAMTAARLQRVRDYVDAHLDGTVTIEALASAANLSRYHFCRCFKRAVGETPHRYVMRLRAERATRLLSTDMSSGLADVAQLCGFSDQSHMSRWIKHCYRITPGLIREGLQAH